MPAPKIDYTKLSDKALKELHESSGDFSKLSDESLDEVYKYSRPEPAPLQYESETPNLDVIKDVAGRYHVPESTLRKRAAGMGMAAEDASMLEKGVSKLSGVADAAFIGLPTWVAKKMEDDYTEQAIDELKDKLEKKKSGLQSAAETAASILAPVPGAGLLKGATKGMKGIAGIAANVGRGAAESAIAGGVTGLTESTSGTEEDSALSGAASGAKWGAGLGLAGKALGAAGEKLQKSGDKMANRFAYRATGGLKSDINKAMNSGATPEKIGETLLKTGALSHTTARGGEDLKRSIDDKLAGFSKKQDDFISAMDAKGQGGVPIQDITGRLQNEIKMYRGRAGKDNQRYADSLQSELDSILSTQTSSAAGPVNQLSFQDALNLKRNFDKAGKFQNRTEAAGVEAARTARKSVKDALDDSLLKVSSPTEVEAYKSDRMKSKYLLDARSAVEESQNRQTANKFLGLTDNQYMGGGLTASLITMNPMTAINTVAAVAAKKAAEKYGDSAAALSLKKLSNAVQKNPALLQKYGDSLRNAAIKGHAQLEAAHGRFMRQDPQYRDMVNGISTGAEEGR